MNAKRIAIAVGFVALSLLLSIQTTSAATDNSISSRIVRETVNWTIPADQCANFPAGVSLEGTGKRVAVITTKKKPDGSKLVVINDFVQGTAEDSNGNTYYWIYANHDRNRTKGSNSRVHVNMTDLFELSGTGGISNYTAAFHWTWTYTPPEPEFPPAHNFKQLYTLGDPVNCDPI